MRFRLTANGPRLMLELVTAVLFAGAQSAQAQITFDGNLLFNNNASGTLAGQFAGTAGAGAPACTPGFTAAQLGTLVYTHNTYADPLLSDAPYRANFRPNFQPALGSPAYGNAVTVPAGGFFEQVCYRHTSQMPQGFLTASIFLLDPR